MYELSRHQNVWQLQEVFPAAIKTPSCDGVKCLREVLSEWFLMARFHRPRLSASSIKNSPNSAFCASFCTPPAKWSQLLKCWLGISAIEHLLTLQEFGHHGHAQAGVVSARISCSAVALNRFEQADRLPDTPPMEGFPGASGNSEPCPSV